MNYLCVENLNDIHGNIIFMEGTVYNGEYDDDGYFCLVGEDGERYAFANENGFQSLLASAE